MLCAYIAIVLLYNENKIANCRQILPIHQLFICTCTRIRAPEILTKWLYIYAKTPRPDLNSKLNSMTRKYWKFGFDSRAILSLECWFAPLKLVVHRVNIKLTSESDLSTSKTPISCYHTSTESFLVIFY